MLTEVIELLVKSSTVEEALKSLPSNILQTKKVDNYLLIWDRTTITLTELSRSGEQPRNIILDYPNKSLFY